MVHVLIRSPGVLVSLVLRWRRGGPSIEYPSIWRRGWSGCGSRGRRREVLEVPQMDSVGPLEVPGRSNWARNVAGPLGQRPAERADLAQGGGNALAEACHPCLHQLAAVAAVEFAVGRNNRLVGGPGGLDLDVLIGPEQYPPPGARRSRGSAEVHGFLASPLVATHLASTDVHLCRPFI
jgi:hypothetical protein